MMPALNPTRARCPHGLGLALASLVQAFFISARDIAELFAFCLAMQSFMAFLLALLPRAVSCWCGVEAAEGSAQLFAGASAASLDFAARL